MPQFLNVPRITKRGNRGAVLCWLFGISPIWAENTSNRVFISRFYIVNLFHEVWYECYQQTHQTI